MKPKIYVVGFGPGERPYMTQQAVDAMTQADLVASPHYRKKRTAGREK